MIHVGVKIILLSFAVVSAVIEEDARVGRTGALSFRQQTTETTPTEATFHSRDGPPRNSKTKLMVALESLLKLAETCRKNQSNLSDETFRLNLYEFLLDDLAGTPNKTAIFHCSINKGLVDNLRGKLHQLENFQKSFVPSPKNNSTESPGQNAQQRNPHKETRSHSLGNITEGVENNLKLKLEDEWKAKVPYMSHIYLGSSLFPLITEESRILENGHTTARMAGYSRTRLGKKQNDSKTLSRVYQLLTPQRWTGNPKNGSRFTRSLHGMSPPLSAKDNSLFYIVSAGRAKFSRNFRIQTAVHSVSSRSDKAGYLYAAFYSFSVCLRDKVQKVLNDFFRRGK